jgi:hypothetical protein
MLPGAILSGGLHKARAYPPILEESCQIYVPEVLHHGLEFFQFVYSQREREKEAN